MFARKIIRQFGNVTKDDVDNEVRAVKKLCETQHPNIVQVFGYNAEGIFHFIDMELCNISLQNYLDGGELKELSKWSSIPKNEIPTHAYKISQHILNGLAYIHCLGEVHRDLSPNNGRS